MAVITLRIPLILIRANYQASSRRPLTDLDRLVLQSIYHKTNTVEGLVSIFHLPERLLVECLVDLMEIGLVALHISEKGGFSVTTLGSKTIEGDLELFSEKAIDSEYSLFLRENLTGRIIKSQDVTYDTVKGDVFEHGSPPILDIPVGIVERFLIQKLKNDRRHLHYIESIAPIRDQISLSVSVDQNGSITGLPPEWGHLRQQLLDEAERRTGKKFQHIPQQDTEFNKDYWSKTSVHITEDLLLNADKHIQTLNYAIENANTHILIVSAHMSETILSELTDSVICAIKRDVRIDMLWGLSGENNGVEYNKIATKWLKKIRKDSGDAGNRITINNEMLGADAKILIWDSAPECYQAVITSYNWLFGAPAIDGYQDGSEIGICINDQRCIGEICSTIAGWLEISGQQLSGVAMRWRNIGRNQSKIENVVPDYGDSSCEIRITYNEDHESILSQSLWNSHSRCLVVSHNINRTAIGDGHTHLGRLGILANVKTKPSSFKLTLMVGKHTKADRWEDRDQERLEELVNKANGNVVFNSGSHARVLVYDDYSLISSYNFLSTTRNTKHIGIFINGKSVADKLWGTFVKQ